MIIIFLFQKSAQTFFDFKKHGGLILEFEDVNQGDLIQWFVFFISTRERFEKGGKEIVDLIQKKIDEVLNESA